MCVNFLDLKSALGKKRTDGKHAPLQPLTKIQRIHVGRLVEKYGDDYQVEKRLNSWELFTICLVKCLCLTSFLALQSMFMDIKLNKMQHSVATLEKLCKRYHVCKDKNPLIVGSWEWYNLIWLRCCSLGNYPPLWRSARFCCHRLTVVIFVICLNNILVIWIDGSSLVIGVVWTHHGKLVVKVSLVLNTWQNPSLNTSILCWLLFRKRFSIFFYKLLAYEQKPWKNFST